MSSGSDDRRNDPTVFGGSGAPQQPDAQWQRPPGESGAGAQNPDPTAVWMPGGPGLPPGLTFEGSGPPPGLPDPTPWTPAGPHSWESTTPSQADPTQLRTPTAAGPAAADPTQVGSPTWPGANPAAAQADPGQPWGGQPPQWNQPGPQWNQPGPQWNQPGQQWNQPGPQWNQPGQQWNPAGQQWNPAGQQPWAAPAPQQPVPQYGEIPALEHGGAQSYGQPFSPGPPKSGSKAGIWIAAGFATVLVGATTITAVALSGGDERDTATGGSVTPSMVSALSTTPNPTTTPPPTTTPTGAAANQTPLIDGYQVVASPDRGAAYDVPPSWKVATETTIGGFGEPPGESVIGKGYATDGRDYCPGSTRTVSLLTGSKLGDHAAAGAELGTKTAPLAYNGSTGTPKPSEPLQSMDGKINGMFTETTGTVPDPKPGCASTYSIYTYAFAGANDGSFVMVMVADTGVPDAIDAATAKRILSTIRAL